VEETPVPTPRQAGTWNRRPRQGPNRHRRVRPPARPRRIRSQPEGGSLAHARGHSKATRQPQQLSTVAYSSAKLSQASERAGGVRYGSTATAARDGRVGCALGTGGSARVRDGWSGLRARGIRRAARGGFGLRARSGLGWHGGAQEFGRANRSKPKFAPSPPLVRPAHCWRWGSQAQAQAQPVRCADGRARGRKKRNLLACRRWSSYPLALQSQAPDLETAM